MKAGWEIKTLGEVYDVRDGTHDSPKYVESGYPLITSKNLKYKRLSFDNVQYIAEEDYKKINARSAVHKGDVLFAMIGTIGNPTIVEFEPSFAIKNVALFKVPQVHSSGFLKYYLETEEVVSKMVSEAKGTTQKFVGLGYLRNFPIKIPALTEQKRIVAILDEAFEGIAKARANAEQNLQNARALFESHLQSVFSVRGGLNEPHHLATSSVPTSEGWMEKTLSEVCEIKPPKNEAKKLLKNSDLVSFAPMEDLGINQKYLNPSKQRTLEDVAGSYTYFAEGDVLLAKITPCFENGKLGIAKNLTNGIGFGSSEYIVFRPKKELSNEFLYYFLSRKHFIEEGAQRMSGAVGHKRVSKEFIENYKISFPLLKLQMEIVRKIDALSKETQRLEALYQRKIKLLDELKKSLLQQAFAGEL